MVFIRDIKRSSPDPGIETNTTETVLARHISFTKETGKRKLVNAAKLTVN
jgi:hypothetical protein